MFKFLKDLAPKAFNNGLKRCNLYGQKLITIRNCQRFLDIGCGDGSLTMEFAKNIAPAEIHGIEFADEDILKASTKGIKCSKQDLNSFWNFPDNYFDVILSSQNIEHLHNTRIYLQECYRTLKPGGQLLVLTENLASWVNIFSLLFGWQPFSTANINGWSAGNPLSYTRDKELPVEFVDKYNAQGLSGVTGHVRVLAYGGLKELILRTGFKNVKNATRGYLPFYGPFSDLMCTLDSRHGHFLISTGYKQE